MRSIKEKVAKSRNFVENYRGFDIYDQTKLTRQVSTYAGHYWIVCKSITDLKKEIDWILENYPNYWEDRALDEYDELESAFPEGD